MMEEINDTPLNADEERRRYALEVAYSLVAIDKVSAEDLLETADNIENFLLGVEYESHATIKEYVFQPDVVEISFDKDKK